MHFTRILSGNIEYFGFVVMNKLPGKAADLAKNLAK